MEANDKCPHPQARLFTLRLWEEPLDEGHSEWRGRVQELTSGEAAYFRDWPGLVTSLQRLIQTTAPATQGSDRETTPPARDG